MTSQTPLDVLVVDNDTTLAGVISSYLVDNGVCAASSWDGIDALEVVRARRPSLVLIDVDMPGVDGLEVTRRLNALSEPPRIILMSGYDDCVRTALQSRLEIMAVVEKPMPLRLLARSVRHWLSANVDAD